MFDPIFGVCTLPLSPAYNRGNCSIERKDMSSKRPLRIAIIAGELSGDLLGAGLVSALKAQYSEIEFTGVGGPHMIEAGFSSFLLMERLSIMGIGDVVRHAFSLLNIRRKLIKTLLQYPPDIFVGIDLPDFNLPIAKKLRQRGVKTVHYVSPKVWAWREKRVVKIQEAVDLMLTLFPFEAKFYEHHQVPVKFVGHPLADLIDFNIPREPLRQAWGYSASDEVITVLPGSRRGEMKYMGPLFIDTMVHINAMHPHIQFILPMATTSLRQQFEQQLQRKKVNLNIKIIDKQARDAMLVADLVLSKAGTSTLEAMLLKRPMVVAYQCGRITGYIVDKLIKIRFMALPNLLANRGLVSEFVQHRAQPVAMAAVILELLQDKAEINYLQQKFDVIHAQLRCNASVSAARAILEI
jgi:lipid-A-disaccharide synthase